MKANQPGDDLRERLKEVAERYSQADIAKRTGASKANVHRYLKAGKVPADFITALVREFGLSTEWMLLGRGPMLASEVTPEDASEAQRLLEVVLKLNAVGHQKLAALAADQPARMLRELRDATTRHEQLREKLAQRARPLARKLLNEARLALAEDRVRDAAVSLDSADELGKLVDSPMVLALRHMMRGTLSFYNGDLELQRVSHRIALGALMQAGRLRDQQFLRTCYNYCAGLAQAGLLQESMNTAEAMLLLAGKDPPEWDEDWLLRMPRVLWLLHTGKLAEALPLLVRIAAGCSADMRPYVEETLLRTHMLSGALDFETLARRAGYRRGTELGVLLYAVLDPSPNAVPLLLKGQSTASGQLPEAMKPYVQAAKVIATGKGKVEWPDPPQPVFGFYNAVLDTEIAQRKGNAAEARKACRRAAAIRADLGPAVCPDIAAQAAHAIHCTHWMTSRDAEEARQWLQQHAAAGYLCLQGRTGQNP